MKHLHYILLLTFLFFFISLCKGQESSKIFTELNKQLPGQGKINLASEKNFDKVYSYYYERQQEKNGVGIYRIRVYSDSGQGAKSKAFSIRSQIRDMYNFKCEVQFDSPFYKVYIGDYRTRSEALKHLKIIERSYPNDSYMIFEVIPFSEL